MMMMIAIVSGYADIINEIVTSNVVISFSHVIVAIPTKAHVAGETHVTLCESSVLLAIKITTGSPLFE